MYSNRIQKTIKIRGMGLLALNRGRNICITGLLLSLLATVGCSLAPQAEPPQPTRVAAPTFTPTPVVENAQVDPNAVSATKAALAAAQPATVVETDNQAAQSQGGEAAQPEQAAEPVAEEPTPVPPTPTPEPQNPEAIVNIDLINVRGGPGTTYNVVGGANQGDRYIITGRNQGGDWWEVDYNGGKGWLFGQLVTAENAGNVAIAANIPAPPPPTATPVPPPPTAVPAPAEPPPPAEPPKPKYEFNIAVASKCDPQAAGTWFSGKTYKNGNPASGYKVVFSYAPDGPPVTNPITTGPHTGYEGWDAGYYSHIIAAPGTGPRAGTWHVWVVNDGGQRISEIASFTSDGDANTCNQAVVDFDSR